MVKIYWTFQAKHDLKEIFHYIAKNSRRYAHQQITSIKSIIKHLTTRTLIGINPEFNDLSIREFIIGNYRIIYKTKTKTQIDILLVNLDLKLLKNRFKIINKVEFNSQENLEVIYKLSTDVYDGFIYFSSLWNRDLHIKKGSRSSFAEIGGFLILNTIVKFEDVSFELSSIKKNKRKRDFIGYSQRKL